MFILSKNQVGDGLTKSLPNRAFESIKYNINLTKLIKGRS
jgi:hypothetical protein